MQLEKNYSLLIYLIFKMERKKSLPKNVLDIICTDIMLKNLREIAEYFVICSSFLNQVKRSSFGLYLNINSSDLVIAPNLNLYILLIYKVLIYLTQYL